MLKDNGVVSLAVPDKRYCFEHFRSVTDIQKVLDDYLAPRELGGHRGIGRLLSEYGKPQGKIVRNRINGCFGRNAYRSIHALGYIDLMLFWGKG